MPEMAAGAGRMGFAEVAPADGLVAVTLACGDCGRDQTWPAPFYADRILVLGRARREGWAFLADGRRRCPVCQAMATQFGRWGSLAHELRPGGVHESPRPAHEPPAPLHISAAPPPAPLQLDLFGAAA